jgi:hypothetical protein
MDPNFSAMLAVAASNESLILHNTNSPLRPLTFGTASSLKDSSATHNHQPKTTFLLQSHEQLNALTTTSSNNNFIAASPLSSIGSLSSATDTSPASFSTLSTLSSNELEQFTKFISSGRSLSSVVGVSSSDSVELLNRLTGALAQTMNSSSIISTTPLSNTQSQLFNTPMISSSHSSVNSEVNNSPLNDASFDQPDEAASSINGPRRIRRRRPKSPKLQSLKKPNNIVIKQEVSIFTINFARLGHFRQINND